jgi:hypothetical protein
MFKLLTIKDGIIKIINIFKEIHKLKSKLLKLYLLNFNDYK